MITFARRSIVSGNTSVRLLNGGRAAYISASGQLRHLNLLNTITERVEHIPAFSLIADADKSYLQLEYLGVDQLNGATVQKIAVSWSSAVKASDQQELLRRTRVVYFMDADSSLIVQTEYTRGAEEDSNALMHYRIVYSNYTEFDGRLIPTTMTTYLNRAFLSELTMTSYQESSSTTATMFDIPETTK